MATTAEVQAELNAGDSGGARIIRDEIAGTVTNYYVVGGAQFSGRTRWCQATTADNAATQATSITTAMRA